ncbi:MAG: PD-(D/E)XK nuclease family protein, partial [Clostridia bacterium]|nr:PD-(D/E)XK nuclease family protein [Clostridia bacterium]
AEFMLYVPYRSIVESEVEDKVLVQGVVDLIIEHEDNIDIVDYKFSSLPIRVLKQKYSEQLALYKLAVEKAYNKKVSNTYIYSINTGELY